MPFPHAIPLDSAMWIWLVVAAIAAAALWFIDAPYGRQARRGWGPGIPTRLAWCLMEAVVLVSFFATLIGSAIVPSSPTIVFALMVTLHYVNRAFIYPWRTRTRGKTMPTATMLLSMAFNLVNGFFLAADLARLNRPEAWFTDPRFIIGSLIFYGGMILNWHSDGILVHLRKPGETGYRIPYGGGFRWAASPNLLGEIVEWAGFALLTWSFAGLTFFVWTCANLVPRARANQRWYRARFDDYPRSRRALIPGIW